MNRKPLVELDSIRNYHRLKLSSKVRIVKGSEKLAKQTPKKVEKLS